MKREQKILTIWEFLNLKCKKIEIKRLKFWTSTMNSLCRKKHAREI